MLNSYHFPTFLQYYRRLLLKSRQAAKTKILCTIQMITGTSRQPVNDPHKLQDFILQFMYTVGYDFLN